MKKIKKIICAAICSVLVINHTYATYALPALIAGGGTVSAEIATALLIMLGGGATITLGGLAAEEVDDYLESASFQNAMTEFKNDICSIDEKVETEFESFQKSITKGVGGVAEIGDALWNALLDGVADWSSDTSLEVDKEAYELMDGLYVGYHQDFIDAAGNEAISTLLERQEAYYGDYEIISFYIVGDYVCAHLCADSLVSESVLNLVYQSGEFKGYEMTTGKATGEIYEMKASKYGTFAGIYKLQQNMYERVSKNYMVVNPGVQFGDGITAPDVPDWSLGLDKNIDAADVPALDLVPDGATVGSGGIAVDSPGRSVSIPTNYEDLIEKMINGELTRDKVDESVGATTVVKTQDMTADDTITAEDEVTGYSKVVTTGNTLHNDLPISDYTVTGLDKIFPFCIPFDIYNLFAVLNAPPEAPKFKWTFDFSSVNEGWVYTIELDLSEFDEVAEIVRRFFLLLFCIGLALKTRDLIRG